jgi:transcriptional regulator GlxA family with amidase domain
MTAGIDQALAMVEADLGADVARIAARNMVIHHRRAGGLPQSSALLDWSPGLIGFSRRWFMRGAISTPR